MNILKNTFRDALKAIISQFSGFYNQLVILTTSINYALSGSGLVMHFDAMKDQTDDEYLTVAQLSQRYPAFSQGSIRWLIFNGAVNNFDKVVRRIGRKVVISLQGFKKFIEEQTQG